MAKIFVVSLPRTGTSSLCVALLSKGFKVAHTAYTKACVEAADVMADTPIYADYPKLDALFPDSKFIYLERPLSVWLPSIQVLLRKLLPRLAQARAGHSPVLRRSVSAVFGPLSEDIVNDEGHLKQCYLQHRAQVLDYFSHRAQDLLMCDVSDPNDYEALMQFLGVAVSAGEGFPHLNRAGQVNAWQNIKDPNKVDSFAFGSDRRRYFDF